MADETPVNEEVTDAQVSEELAKVAEAAEQVAGAAAVGGIPTPAAHDSTTMDLILDVTLQVTVEVGRTRMTIQDLLQMGQGSVMELEKLAGEPLDIYINGQQVARGEAVIVNEKFGVRLTDVISTEDRLEGLG